MLNSAIGNVPRNITQPPRAGSGPIPNHSDDRRASRAINLAERNVFDSPEKSRPRRNSESSVMDKEKSEEDRRRRERRKAREREHRDKDGKSKDAKSRDAKDTKDGKARPGRKTHGLDVIDKLDVTGIYGQGREYIGPCHTTIV